MLELVDLEAHADKQAGPDLRRPEAAGRDRPRADQPSAGPAARRAARRARPQAPAAPADRARHHPRRGRHHLHLRHPRPERGDVDLRPHRRDEPRRIEQIGKPAEIYEAPRSCFVAAFIGDTNFLDGIVARTRRRAALPARIDGSGPRSSSTTTSPHQPGELVHLTVRPEKLLVSRERPVTTGPRTPCRARSRTSSTSAPTPATGCAAAS